MNQAANTEISSYYFCGKLALLPLQAALMVKDSKIFGVMLLSRSIWSHSKIVFLNFLPRSLEVKRACLVPASPDGRHTKTAFRGFVLNSEESAATF